MPSLPRADEAHVVTSGYWKIIADWSGGGLSVAAFIMRKMLRVIPMLVRLHSVSPRLKQCLDWTSLLNCQQRISCDWKLMSIPVGF